MQHCACHHARLEAYEKARSDPDGPVHDQRIRSAEFDLHMPALERLYDLHQLGMTDRVFIDASHSRLHHVIGVLEQVTSS